VLLARQVRQQTPLNRGLFSHEGRHANKRKRPLHTAETPKRRPPRDSPAPTYRPHARRRGVWTENANGQPRAPVWRRGNATPRGRPRSPRDPTETGQRRSASRSSPASSRANAARDG
jgi:hypothetical protein